MTTAPPITLKASELHALVRPVLPFAAKEALIPALHAVLIESRGDYATATATDRYRAGVSRVKLDEPPAAGFSLLVAIRDLREVLCLFKPSRGVDRTLTITIIGDGTFAVEPTEALYGFVAAKVTWRVVKGDFPAEKVREIVADALATEPNMTTAAMFNPHYLADCTAEAGRYEPIRLWGEDPAKGVAFSVGDNFVGVIMLTRTGGRTYLTYDADSWRPLLTDSTPSPSKKPRARKTTTRRAPRKSAA